MECHDFEEHGTLALWVVLTMVFEDPWCPCQTKEGALRGGRHYFSNHAQLVVTS